MPQLSRRKIKATIDPVETILRESKNLIEECIIKKEGLKILRWELKQIE
jgi:hypothetical protein